ncbi:hypothetical protein [Pseudodesulfovibrio portus]|uniref:Uncharacterized protein n=1 Tax=Pseudodesulfovibrio portus TaxID=231439 RepID=A0ABM8ANH1_9BACT|nr:hypothetical protein [Pseudodesulfovibrio portus]BDQ32959.1 hypothetical protein JCM14722_05010 [Pseudodesulfovibrio portus]
MSEDALKELMDFLEEANARVKQLEAEGDAAMAEGGQTAFQAKLEKKAELLASLGTRAAPLTKAIGGDLGRNIDDRLERFASSAATALRIGSVFFMTALLYPEDHQPGEPNDLETFIAELRKGI